MSRAMGLVQRGLTLLVWIGAGVSAALLLDKEPVRGYPGTLESKRWMVRAPATGVLRDWSVVEREDVVAGQLLGALDDRELLQRIHTVELDVERLSAESQRVRREVEREEALHLDDLRTERRRFERDLEDAEWSVLELTAELEEDKIRLESQSIDVERLEKLVSKDLATEEELISERLKRDSLAERIRQIESLRTGRESQVASARGRLEEVDRRIQAETPDAVVESQLKPWERQIAVRRTELDQVALERERLRIVAPRAGRLENLTVQAGETLVVGQPLVEIAELAPGDLVAWIPEAEIGGVPLGTELDVVCASRPEESFAVVVVQLGTRAVRLPERHWLDPTREEWAIPVVCRAGQPPAFVPGEALRFRHVEVP